MRPIPIARYLTPEAAPAAPPGFTAVSAALVGGLPHQLPLDGDLSLLLVAPSGLAREWRDADPAALVSRGAWELAPRPAAEAELVRAPVRLLARRGGLIVAAVPLSAGRRALLPPGDEARGVAIELIVLDWEILAGNLRGPGDVGGRIAVAWRRADRAPDRYTRRPLSAGLRLRLSADDRYESEVGAEDPAGAPKGGYAL